MGVELSVGEGEGLGEPAGEGLGLGEGSVPPTGEGEGPPAGVGVGDASGTWAKPAWERIVIDEEEGDETKRSRLVGPSFPVIFV